MSILSKTQLATSRKSYDGIIQHNHKVQKIYICFSDTWSFLIKFCWNLVPQLKVSHLVWLRFSHYKVIKPVQLRWLTQLQRAMSAFQKVWNPNLWTFWTLLLFSKIVIIVMVVVCWLVCFVDSLTGLKSPNLSLLWRIEAEISKFFTLI